MNRLQSAARDFPAEFGPITCLRGRTTIVEMTGPLLNTTNSTSSQEWRSMNTIQFTGFINRVTHP